MATSHTTILALTMYRGQGPTALRSWPRALPVEGRGMERRRPTGSRDRWQWRGQGDTRTPTRTGIQGVSDQLHLS